MAKAKQSGSGKKAQAQAAPERYCRPLGDRVLIRLDQPEKQTPGGILLPDSARNERPGRGEVLAVGPGKATADGSPAPLAVKPGDRVLFTKWAGTPVDDAGQCVIMREEDVLAIDV